jgi:phosphate transport system substrate-binding protein
MQNRGASSRLLQATEVQRLAQRQQNVGIAFLVAKDGLSLYLHPDNPIRDLRLEQVKDIYTGKIKNWREVGGKDEPIVAYSRAPSSDTYLYFYTITKPEGVVKLFIDWGLEQRGPMRR